MHMLRPAMSKTMESGKATTCIDAIAKEPASMSISKSCAKKDLHRLERWEVGALWVHASMTEA